MLHDPVRDALEVFEDHLQLRLSGDLETDLERNYSPSVLLMTVNSVLRGHEGIRESASRLLDQLPDATFEIVARQIVAPYALLIWRARSSNYDAIEGADSFYITEGKIHFQSIHYGLVAAHERQGQPKVAASLSGT